MIITQRGKSLIRFYFEEGKKEENEKYKKN
jgi:hypothetical protein